MHMSLLPCLSDPPTLAPPLHVPPYATGVVSVFSQAFPRVPHEEPHHPDGLPEDYHDLVSGTYTYICIYVGRIGR